MKYFFITLLGILWSTQSCKMPKSSIQDSSAGAPKKKSAEWYYQQGIVETKMTNTYVAIDDFTQAIKKKSHYEEAYVGRAKAYQDVDSIDREIADYDTLVAWAGNNQEKRGNLYLLIGNSCYLKSEDSLACLYWKMSRDMNNLASWDKIRKFCK